MTDQPLPKTPEANWPRWEVFKQDAPGKPHQAVGSVHATDAELALLAARHVFARRPSAVSMWVAPADAILQRTAEELDADKGWREHPSKGPGELYQVFRKSSHKRSMTFVDHVGSVDGASAADALATAVDAFRDGPALAWWIVPERSIYRSGTDAETLASWFEPAADKTYKQQAYYASVASRERRRKEPS